MTKKKIPSELSGFIHNGIPPENTVRFKRYQQFDKMIFSSEENEKAWNEADPQIKESCMSYLRENARNMSNTLAIEMIAAYISELTERIEKLEREKDV